MNDVDTQASGPLSTEEQELRDLMDRVMNGPLGSLREGVDRSEEQLGKFQKSLDRLPGFIQSSGDAISKEIKTARARLEELSELRDADRRIASEELGRLGQSVHTAISQLRDDLTAELADGVVLQRRLIAISVLIISSIIAGTGVALFFALR